MFLLMGFSAHHQTCPLQWGGAACHSGLGWRVATAQHHPCRQHWSRVQNCKTVSISSYTAIRSKEHISGHGINPCEMASPLWNTFLPFPKPLGLVGVEITLIPFPSSTPCDTSAGCGAQIQIMHFSLRHLRAMG